MVPVDRTFIKNIKLVDFKSFKDSIEIGPFHPYSNAIIGSNGSGKSNLFDAILFTFGKKAINLRSDNLKSLINNTGLKKNLFTSSSIILRSESDFFQKFFKKKKEICVTRKFFKTQKSIYYLNGKEIKFFFLKKIFCFFKIPTNKGNFFIKQGEIEQFSKMESSGKVKKKMGIIEFIEDISSSSCYYKNFFKKMYYANCLQFKKKVLGGFSIEKIIKEDFFLAEEYFKFLSKSIKNLFFIRSFVLSVFSGLISKILEWRLSRFSSKIQIILLKKIKNNFFLNFILLKILGYFYKKKKYPVKFSGKKRNFFEIFSRNYITFFFLEQNLGGGKNFIKFHKNKIKKDVFINFYFFIYYFFLNKIRINIFSNGINLTFKFKLSRNLKNLLNLLDSRFTKVSLNSWNDLIKVKKIKKILEIYQHFIRIKLWNFTNEKKIFFYEQNLMAMNYLKNLNSSCILNFSKIKYNYSNKKLNKKIDLWKKLIKELKSAAKKKFPILKKKSSKLKKFDLFFSFPLYYTLIANEKIFSHKYKTFFYDNHKFFLSDLVYFRNNFNKQITIKRRIKIFRDLNIEIENNNKKNLNKNLIFLDSKFEIFEFYCKERKIVKNFKKKNLRPIKENFQFNYEDLDFLSLTSSKNLLTKGKLRDLLLLFLKKKPTLKKVDCLAIFLGGRFFLQNNPRVGRFYQHGKNDMEIKFLFSKFIQEILKNFLFQYLKKISIRKNLSGLSLIFFKPINKKACNLISKIDFIFLIEKFRKTLFESESLKIFSYNGLNFIFILKLLNLVSKDYDNHIICESKKKDYIIITKNKKTVKKNNYKIIFIENNFKETNKKFQKSFFKNNNRITKSFRIIYNFMGKTIFLMISLGIYFFRVLLGQSFQKKIKLWGFKKAISKIKYWQILLKNRLKFFKNQILKNYNINNYFWNLKEFNILTTDSSSFNFKILNSIFNKLSIKIEFNDKTTFSKNFAFFYLNNKNNLNFNFLWKNMSSIFKKKYFGKKICELKKAKDIKQLNLLICKNFHLTKNSDLQTCMLMLNKSLNENYKNIKKHCYMKLSSIDNYDMFSKGLKVTILYKNYKVENPFQLSGGEKTLSSFCLILSSGFFLPSRWYLFDEIDAALDFKNITKISLHLKYQNKRYQILIITLRNNMIITSNHVFGFYKLRNKSKITCLKV
jgi:hypothetical protein